MNGKLKTFLKITFFVLLALIVIVSAIVIYCSIIVADVKLDESKLVNLERGINFYDNEGNMIEEQSGGVSVTDIKDIPEHVKNAFIAVEDKRFYSHKGVDYKGFLRAMLNNIKSFSFKEGASTISQQLIKNTHLSNKKTIKRKLSEMKLARLLEKKYSKEEILEKYLNTIYFGEGCYGITAASRYYFNKTPQELSINESAMLAAVIKAPSVYSPYKNEEKSNDRKKFVLNKMYEQNFITENQYSTCTAEKIKTESEHGDTPFDYIGYVKKELGGIMDSLAYSGKKFNVYTYYDESVQNAVSSSFADDISCDKTAIVMNDKNKVIAFSSTSGEFYRQTGSTLKPLIVYAPAIEYNVVSSLTPVLDEKTDFGGYSPSNYNDVYYGYVSVKESLAKSLNSCAVKLLNYTGIERAKSLMEKTEISFTEKDNSLCVALGCTEKGATLTELTAAYGIFSDGGYYYAPTAIKYITVDGRKITDENNDKKRVIGEDTAYIMDDMLRYTVTDGTSKKLSFLDFPVYAKTGTVGISGGNTDAYNISFNKDYSIGVWYGNKDNSLMPNNITGGTYPTATSYRIWEKLDIKNPTLFSAPESVSEVPLDKISYDNDHLLITADDNSPQRFILKGIFKKNNLPEKKSTRFSNPIVDNYELSVNNSEIIIRLCLTELFEAKIYRYENNVRTMIFDTAGCDNNVIYKDDKLKEGAVYNYTVIPYFKNGDKVIEGEEKNIGTVKISFNDSDWWDDDFF